MNDSDLSKIKVVFAAPAEARTEKQLKKHVRSALEKSYKSHPKQASQDFETVFVIVLNRYDVYGENKDSYFFEEDYSLKEILKRKNGKDKNIHVKCRTVNFAYRGPASKLLNMVTTMAKKNNPSELQKWENKKVSPSDMDLILETARNTQDRKTKIFISEKMNSLALTSKECWMNLFDEHENVLKELVRGVLNLPELDIDSVLDEMSVVYDIQSDPEVSEQINSAIKNLMPVQHKFGRLPEGVNYMPQTSNICRFRGLPMDEVNRKAINRGFSVVEFAYPRFAGCNIPAQPELGFTEDTALIVILISNPEDSQNLVTSISLSEEISLSVSGSVPLIGKPEIMIINLAADASSEDVRHMLLDLEERDLKKIHTPLFREALADMRSEEGEGCKARLLMDHSSLITSGQAMLVDIYPDEDPVEKINQAFAERIGNLKS